MNSQKPSARKIGRDAETGRFTSVEKARQPPKTHIIETVKKSR